MKPFHPAESPPGERERLIREARELALKLGWPHREMRAGIRAAMREWESLKFFVNDRYQVGVRDAEVGDRWPAMIYLTIKRLDREPIHDWRDLQEIKNLLVGPEHEAVELYPAESRLLDTSNQYHLWVLKDPEQRFPFGFWKRAVIGETGIGRAKQRPFAEERSGE